MAGDRLIEAYLEGFRASLDDRADVDELVDEIDDHLHTSLARHRRDGLDLDLARQRTLASFGDPDLVASAYASHTLGDVLMPTSFTRLSGNAMRVGTVAWVLGFILLVIAGSLDMNRSWEDGPQQVFGFAALCAFIGAITIAIGTFGVHRRLAGTAKRTLWATVAAVIGALATPMLWFPPLYMGLTAVAALLTSRALRSYDVGPAEARAWLSRGALVALAATGVMLVGVLSGFAEDDGDGFSGGQFLVLSVLTTCVLTYLAVGWFRVGAWLGSEDPADDPDNALTA